MSDNLKKLMQDLSKNVELQDEFAQNADQVMSRYGLTDDEKTLVTQQDTNAIRKRIGEEDSPIPINVIHSTPNDTK
jgi:aldehyde:ferredoxin oxidoreductase